MQAFRFSALRTIARTIQTRETATVRLIHSPTPPPFSVVYDDVSRLSNLGETMSHENIVMPAAVRQELDLLLATIKRAATSVEAERAGLRAEGFVLGVERLKALQPASIEALYLLVEQAVEVRSGEIAATR